MSLQITPPAEESGGAVSTENKVLAGIKTALAKAKSRMDPHEKNPDMQKVLHAIDMYSQLKSLITRKYGGQAVTNAWLKLYELLCQFRLIERVNGGGGIRAFFNAELPGAFISATNHYMATQHPGVPFEWVASSLYPEGAEVLGDKYGLYECSPDRWLMDADMKGDVTRDSDIRALAARARSRLGGEADLYTSDAGINVSHDYNSQEELTAHIHLGQIVTGLMVLRLGGAMVVKTYTFTDPYSVALIALLSDRFESLHVSKPLTSRPANSEVYLVAVGYLGLTPTAQASLLEAVRRFDYRAPILPVGGPQYKMFNRSVERAARQFHVRNQIPHLNEAVEFLKTYGGRVPKLRQNLKNAYQKAKFRWLEAYPLKPLDGGSRLPEKRRAASGRND